MTQEGVYKECEDSLGNDTLLFGNISCYNGFMKFLRQNVNVVEKPLGLLGENYVEEDFWQSAFAEKRSGAS